MSLIQQAAETERQMWAAIESAGQNGVAVEVLKRLYAKTIDEDKRLDREADAIVGARGHNQRIRQFIRMFVKELEAAQPVIPQTEVTAAQPTPEESDYLAKLATHREAGKCDYAERIGAKLCTRKAVEGGRCKAHS